MNTVLMYVIMCLVCRFKAPTGFNALNLVPLTKNPGFRRRTPKHNM